MKYGFLKMGLLAGSLIFASGHAWAAEIFYGKFENGDLYKYDTIAGVETLVGTIAAQGEFFSPGAGSIGMAFSPTGTLYLFSRGTQSLYTIDTATGAATLVGKAGILAEDLTISLDGSRGFVTADGALYSLNLSTGAATRIGATIVQDGLTTAPITVTVGGTNYAAGSVFGTDSGGIYAINTATGAALGIGYSPGVNETFDFGSDGVLYGHDANGRLTTINLDTLASTTIFNTTPSGVFGMAVRPSAAVSGVPEPASWAMMILGFAAIGSTMRRRVALGSAGALPSS